ncbi:hypothetical protein CCICO_11440 [Corynebacterium ciconiae DSM 44920]|uniref:hypothetical protein n=1 Tax=Corynebacterium ciconiae TaxID=227319 RepID=UPI00039A32A0|nr:hypothetical protein [Corynebacterium ciconiae]WKD62279.1 hypothetical protein CCICO_11440 [Corynebacterium ciconiae DSM 44920]
MTHPQHTGAAQTLYVRISMAIEAHAITHVAELEEIDAQQCRMLRVVELKGPASTSHHEHEITGSAALNAQGSFSLSGMDAPPNPVVPHPDLYGQFEDIVATPLTAAEFEEYWSQRG